MATAYKHKVHIRKRVKKIMTNDTAVLMLVSTVICCSVSSDRTGLRAVCMCTARRDVNCTEMTMLYELWSFWCTSRQTLAQQQQQPSERNIIVDAMAGFGVAEADRRRSLIQSVSHTG